MLRHQLASHLAAAGAAATRRAAGAAILAGRVSKRNGRTVAQPDAHVRPGDEVRFDGVRVVPPIAAESARLWRYFKPAGVLVTHDDPLKRPTVFDALPSSLPRCVSVGRLDLASEGLLLLTDSPSMARHLEQPRSGYAREYLVGLAQPAAAAARRASPRVDVELELPERMVHELASGLTLRSGESLGPMQVERLGADDLAQVLPASDVSAAGSTSAPPRPQPPYEAMPPTAVHESAAKLQRRLLRKLGSGRRSGASSDARLTEPVSCWARMCLAEGKKHAVRKAFAHFDLDILQLVRIGFGPLSLGSLRPGELAEVLEPDILDGLRASAAAAAVT